MALYLPNAVIFITVSPVVVFLLVLYNCIFCYCYELLYIYIYIFFFSRPKVLGDPCESVFLSLEGINR